MKVDEGANKAVKRFKIDELFQVKVGGLDVQGRGVPLFEKPAGINSRPILYRPFDVRWIPTEWLFEPEMSGIKHLLTDNIFLILSQNFATALRYIFVSKLPADVNLLSPHKENNFIVFPLFLNANAGEGTDSKVKQIRILNFNSEIVKRIEAGTGLMFVSEIAAGNLCFATANPDLQDEFKLVFAPIDLFDYVYGVLCSPAFRKVEDKFSEKVFPEIPYPENSDIFWKFVRKGSLIRSIHLLENPEIEDFMSRFPVDGDNIVSKPYYEMAHNMDFMGKIFINESQYFTGAPEFVWNFRTGDYFPAQNWLNERRGQKLNSEAIVEYQRIIAAIGKRHLLEEH